MASQSLVQKIDQHYLTVQALSPVAAETPPEPSNPLPSISWQRLAMPSLIIFIVILLLGIVITLVSRSKNPNKLLIVASIAFFTSVLPLGLYALNQRTETAPHADASLTPVSLQVDQVTNQGFNLTWFTAAPTIGSISLKAANTSDSLRQIIPETSDTKVKSHSISLTSLKPHTTYLILILSGGTWYGLDGQPLIVTTK